MPTPSAIDIGNANATSCATLVDEWVSLGLTDAVVCPGSRSTPMAVALAADGRVRIHVHHDERSGSFMALGLARGTGRSALVLTTSGTAAVQLHAAVVEADLDHVPMLVVTADRPPRLRGVGAPQTIDQVDLYGSSVRWSIDAPLPTDVEPVRWRHVARDAWREANSTDPGPVHLNLPFDEPLLGTAATLPAALGPDQHAVVTEPIDPSSSIDRLGRTGVIIAGAGVDDPAAVLALAVTLGWPVLADPRSGCRVDHPAVIAHVDGLLRGDGPQSTVSSIIRFGSLPASKVANGWIGSLSVPHIHVDPTSAVDDPDRVVTDRLRCSASAFVESFPSDRVARAEPSWSSLWRAADDAFDRAIDAQLDPDAALTEPGIARGVVASIPVGGSLVVSSSMPVRDVEWFSARRDGLTVHSNRGANGIDGVVSTAVGVALAGAPTALLIGDVAFLHDNNGLLGLDRRDVDLCIVIVDNDGGGIFSFLPQAAALEHDRFELLYGTPHGVDIATLAHAHGLPVLVASDDAAVAMAVTASLSIGGVHVVLARTDRATNVAVHDRLQSAGLDAARAVGWLRA